MACIFDSMHNAAVDHILYACAELERGMDEIEALLGTRPVVGGRHPGFGTHNALLSLGTDVYLEVIARDPGLPAPDHGVLVDLPNDADSRLMTWVLRVADIEGAARSASEAEVNLGDVQPCQRETPDGETIRWKLTDPYANRMGGALPFLIDWGETPHPGSVAPLGGRLSRLAIEHPDAGTLRDRLTVLGSAVEVGHGPSARIEATIETVTGPRTLR